MRVLVHDFSGHPFQVQLSRELAGRGHQVLHVYCRSYVTGRGRVDVGPDDPPTLQVTSVDLGDVFSKYSPLTRLRQEAAYAARFVDVATAFGPDAVIESNDPLLTKWRVSRRLKRAGIPWVFWLQDLYSVAIAGELERRAGAAGRLAGRLALSIEGALARRAAVVVPITPDFDDHLDRWKVPPSRRRVIPNWAPVDEITPRPPTREWADRQGIEAEHLVLYAGTLGLKHDPSLLLHLARAVEGNGVAVVVVSEGAGAEHLRRHGGDLANLHLRPFQPYEDLPEVLAAADVVLTVLNGEAGVFSVPSKLLTYLCAGRPVVASVPAVNLAARVLEESGGGTVVEPGDPDAFAERVGALLADEERRRTMGQRGRAFAEDRFDIRSIADQFLALLERAQDPPGRPWQVPPR